MNLLPSDPPLSRLISLRSYRELKLTDVEVVDVVVVWLAVHLPLGPGHAAALQVLSPEPRAGVRPLRLEYAEGVVGEVVREHEPPLGVVRPRSDYLRLESQHLYCMQCTCVVCLSQTDSSTTSG